MTCNAFAQIRPVVYMDGKEKLNGFAVKPAKDSKKGAGVLILPAWKGVDEHSKETAERLAALGYHTFVADIYGEGNYPIDAKGAGERSTYYKTNYKAYTNRINLALQQLIKDGANADKIVVMGYCFGGTGALEVARANMPVKGVVSIHGGLKRDAVRSIVAIKPAILVLHGADDPSVPESQVLAFQKEMRESKADWQMIYYAGAVHAFTHKDAGSDASKGAAYHEVADKRSWQHLLTFLNEFFQAGADLPQR